MIPIRGISGEVVCIADEQTGLKKTQNPIRCPICHKRLFDDCDSGNYHIQIKCPRCANIVEVDARKASCFKIFALRPKITRNWSTA